ncbi:tetratricopeptide repeat protein [Flavobacterium sp. NRK F7]|uniref:tetratricopeptide repeat protein n=1 Tax=Flavobacterium sp. NRK F7 TaxID=2954930 RepID=UPI0020901E3F|nr:hypothetical protein [Flavobacterium sp. NRK F7]MCO6162368.1 hypothetical protein [Flavobacterium sp. NRK F7]
MNTNDLTYLLNKPHAINDKQTMALEIILQQFPFFQSARALHLKGLYNQESFRYNYELKKTAAHTHDRSILFDFITSQQFATLQKNHIENKEALIHNITVTDSLVLTPIYEDTVENIEQEVENTEKIKEDILKPVEEKTEELSQPLEEETIPYETALEIATKEAVTNENVTESFIEKNIDTNVNTISEESNSEENITEDSTILEEKLEIGKPLDFNQSEKHSFQEWLQLTKFTPIEREIEEKTVVKEDEKEDEKLKKIDIIDRFIELNPKISPVKEIVATPLNISKSIEEPTHLMTETLAKIYLEQKKYQKAIQAYEILILKYPEKSSFFANRIKDIKDLQQNNN